MVSPRVLITTSDYLPQLGGLTSYTLNLESCLKANNIHYDLWHWRSEKSRKPDFNEFDIVFNVHYMGGLKVLSKLSSHAKVINIVHGSEILFTSPNPIKKFIKKILKKKHLEFFESSFRNIFISDFTYNKLAEQGLAKDYSRDIIVHNCINTENGDHLEQDIDSGVIKLVSIARDVPHKNISGVIKFAEILNKVTQRTIELFITSDKTTDNPNIKVLNVKNVSNEKRDELLKNAHLNLLFSLDHSKYGFYEGFGLSILEGNIYGCPGIVFPTGGLPENVHHEFNGYVLPFVSESEISNMWEFLIQSYSNLRRNSFEHVMKHHSLAQFSKIITHLISESTTKEKRS